MDTSCMLTAGEGKILVDLCDPMTLEPKSTLNEVMLRGQFIAV